VHTTVIASNSATNSGGGIYVATDCGSGTPFYIDNSVVVSNTAPFGPNIYLDCPDFASSSYTLWGGPLDFVGNVADGTGDKTIVQDTVTSEFFPISNSGSPFFLPAYQLRSTSDARNMAQCVYTTDVRGVARPQGPGCDAGAWEVP
jgi:predicted outer membrane repeat protein